MIAALMLGTLGFAAALAAFLVIRHMRKPENRHPMKGQRYRSYDEMVAGQRYAPYPPTRGDLKPGS